MTSTSVERMGLQSPVREMAPASHRVWLRKTVDEVQQTGEELGEWLKMVAQNELLFKENVYENKELCDLDLRQHRERLYALLSYGEYLSLRFIDLGQRLDRLKEFSTYTNLVDQKVKELTATLFAWHGAVDGQPDIPESFKQAMREVAESKVVDADFDNF